MTEDRQTMLQFGLELTQGPRLWNEGIPASRIALLICDLWDRHYCVSAMSRIDDLAGRVEPFASFLREAGGSIIHAPSGVVGAYRGHPARRNVTALSTPETDQIELPALPRLPIDDSDGGCPDVPRCEPVRNRTSQHPRVSIHVSDFICDTQAEVLGILHARDVDRVLVCGVHLNMCVLNRPFGLRALEALGQRPVLVRDLVDVMYNPASPPYVPHEVANDLVRRYVEEHVCPSVTSEEVRVAGTRSGGRTPSDRF